MAGVRVNLFQKLADISINLVSAWSTFTTKKKLFRATTKLALAPSFSGLPHVAPRVARARLDAALRNPIGGIGIIAAPPSCGKSALLRCAFNDFIRGGGNGVYFGAELRCPSSFFDYFGGDERRADLLKLLPPRSAIVLDQFEEYDSEEMLRLVRYLMQESMLVGNVSVTIATSSVPVAQKLLSLNGGHKVRLACAPHDFQWTPAEVIEFIGSVDLKSNESLQWLRKMALVSGSASFLIEAARLAKTQRCLTPCKDALSVRARSDAHAWHAFDVFAASVAEQFPVCIEAIVEPTLASPLAATRPVSPALALAEDLKHF